MLVCAHLLQNKFRHVRSADFDAIRGQNVDGSAVVAGSRGIHQPHRTNAYPVQVIATGQDVLGLSYVVVGSSDERPDELLVDERLAWIGTVPAATRAMKRRMACLRMAATMLAKPSE